MGNVAVSPHQTAQVRSYTFGYILGTSLPESILRGIQVIMQRIEVPLDLTYKGPMINAPSLVLLPIISILLEQNVC